MISTLYRVEKIALLKSELGELRVKPQLDISSEMQTRLGGVVGGFYIATSERELIKSVELCRELKVKFLLIGTGSKTAIPPEALDLFVIKNRSDNLKIFGIKGKVSREGLGIEEAFIEAQSGISLAGLAEYAKKQKLTGLEDLQTAVGTIGGSFNINKTLREQAHQVNVLTASGNIESKVTNEVLREDIVLSVVFKLKSASV